MARQNYVHLLGVLEKKPAIQTDAAGNYKTAVAFLRVIRGPRSVGDNRYVAKYDVPIIMTHEPETIKQLSGFDKDDALEIKGTIATAAIKKSSFCDKCNTKNAKDGTLVYINPIDVMFIRHLKDETEVNDFLNSCSEISNEILCFCTLVRDPKKITPKSGLTVTQYHVALNRKYRIRTDDPEVKTDYVWVKSYGKNAEDDRERLHVGSEIFVDGCIQARKVQRHAICEACGADYIWPDKAMEIVPFANEYVLDYYTDEDIAKRKEEELAAVKASIFKTEKEKQKTPDDVFSDDDIEAGIDSVN